MYRGSQRNNDKKLKKLTIEPILGIGDPNIEANVMEERHRIARVRFSKRWGENTV